MAVWHKFWSVTIPAHQSCLQTFPIQSKGANLVQRMINGWPQPGNINQILNNIRKKLPPHSLLDVLYLQQIGSSPPSTIFLNTCSSSSKTTYISAGGWLPPIFLLHFQLPNIVRTLCASKVDSVLISPFRHVTFPVTKWSLRWTTVSFSQDSIDLYFSLSWNFRI